MLDASIGLDSAMSGVTAESWIMGSLPHAQPLEHADETKLMFHTDAMVITVYPSNEHERAAVETEIASSQAHTSIVPTLMMLSASDGLIVVYPKVAGFPLSNPDVLEAFLTISLAVRAKLVGDIVDAYAAVVELGFILVDAYLGNILVDFENVKVWCFDWDLSQRGDGFKLEAEQNYGSNRLMAPEEFVQGAWLDQRTNVFNIGKLISILLPDGVEDVDDVIDHATQVEQDDRYLTVQQLADHYRVAAGLPPAHGVILVEDED